MNVRQSSSMSQPRKTRMLHVHDHRPRPVALREQVDQREGNTVPTPAAAAMTSAFDPTVEQPAVTSVAPAPLPQIQVHDADLQRTAEMPRIPPTIDFPIDDEPHVEVGRGAAFAIILLILCLVSAFALIARHLGGSMGTTQNTLTPLTSSVPGAVPSVSVAPTVTVAATPTIVPTVAPPTAAPTTAAPVTVAPTSPEPTTAVPNTAPPTSARQATVPPTVTTVVAAPPATAAGPVAGPGTPQVLSDPLPSGITFADAGPSFALEQQVADGLAQDQWDVVRRLEPAKARFPDSAFAAGYTGLDRASLILVDARPQGDGYRHLIVSVANEGNGAQTSLYCLQWSANAVTGSVVENGGIGRVASLRGNVSSETVVNDPTLVDLITRRCVWR